MSGKKIAGGRKAKTKVSQVGPTREGSASVTQTDTQTRIEAQEASLQSKESVTGAHGTSQLTESQESATCSTEHSQDVEAAPDSEGRSAGSAGYGPAGQMPAPVDAPRSEPSYRCLILNDEYSVASTKDEVKRLSLWLEKNADCKIFCSDQDALPGDSRYEYVRSRLQEDIDTVIMFISQDTSASYKWQIQEALQYTVTERKHIIPLLHNINKLSQELDELLGQFFSEQTSSPDYMEKLKMALHRPRLGNELKDYYKKMLPESLFGTNESLREFGEGNTNVFIAPHCYATEYKRGRIHRRLEGMNDIYTIVQSVDEGSIFITVAEAGYGKTTLYKQLAADWSNNKELLKFEYLYLLTVREIHNHTEDIERIICRDLKLVGKRHEAEVRRSLKFRFSLILIDGYDEIYESDDNDSTYTINKVLSRSIPEAAADIMVNSRPNCTTEVSKLFNKNYIEIPLQKLDDERMLQFCEAYVGKDNMESLQHFSSFIPDEVKRIPLFLKLGCLMWKHYRGHELGEQLNSMGSTLTTFLIMLMNLKEQREHRKSTIKVYNSLMHVHMHPETQRIFRLVAKMSYASLRQNKQISNGENIKMYSFSSSELRKYFLYMNDMQNLGPVEIHKKGDEQEATFINHLFHEYIAGYHLADNMSDLQIFVQSVLQNLTSTDSSLLAYAITMEPRVLQEIVNYLYIPVVRLKTSPMPNLDLSFVATLIEGCQAGENITEFLSKLIDHVPLGNVKTIHSTSSVSIASKSAYKKLINELGKEGCTRLIKRLYNGGLTQEVSVPSSTVRKQCVLAVQSCVDKLSKIKRRLTPTLVITDPVLLACLPSLDFSEAHSLLIDGCLLYIPDIWQTRGAHSFKRIEITNTDFSPYELSTYIGAFQNTAKMEIYVSQCFIMAGEVAKGNPTQIRSLTLQNIIITPEALVQLLCFFKINAVKFRYCELMTFGHTNVQWTACKIDTLQMVDSSVYLDTLKVKLEKCKLLSCDTTPELKGFNITLITMLSMTVTFNTLLDLLVLVKPKTVELPKSTVIIEKVDESSSIAARDLPRLPVSDLSTFISKDSALTLSELSNILMIFDKISTEGGLENCDINIVKCKIILSEQYEQVKKVRMKTLGIQESELDIAALHILLPRKAIIEDSQITNADQSLVDEGYKILVNVQNSNQCLETHLEMHETGNE